MRNMSYPIKFVLYFFFHARAPLGKAIAIPDTVPKYSNTLGSISHLIKSKLLGTILSCFSVCLTMLPLMYDRHPHTEAVSTSDS